MKIPRWILCAAIAAACSITVFAQQAPSGFHTVNCIKVKPEKAAEYHKWIADVVTKLAQRRSGGSAGQPAAYYYYIVLALVGRIHELELETAFFPTILNWTGWQL